MKSGQLKLGKAPPKGATPRHERQVDQNNVRLPEKLDVLERMAQKVFAPRLEAIVQAMLDEAGTITIKRGGAQANAGVVIVELMFGRKEGTRGSWTAYLSGARALARHLWIGQLGFIQHA